jgi:hypothetical protein
MLCQVEKANEDMLNQLYSSIKLMFCTLIVPVFSNTRHSEQDAVELLKLHPSVYKILFSLQIEEPCGVEK